MSSDEFEYYFELKELETLADVPPAELLRNFPRYEAVDRPRNVEPRSCSPAEADERRLRETSQSQSPPRETTTASENLAHTAKPPETPRTASEGRPSSLGKHAHDQSAAHASSPPATAAPPSNGSNLGGGVAPKYSDSAQREGPPGFYDRISVHVLGQFAFCNRAGIYSAENGDEADLDEPQPQWAYVPNFDLERIEEQLAKLLQQLWMLVGLVTLFSVGMVGGVMLQDRRIFYPALVGVIVCFLSLVSTGRMVLILAWRRAAARRAPVVEPSLTLDHIEPVNWWSLLKAGFEPVAYQRQFRHPQLPLEGSPWRVLERGSLRIPVIKSGGSKLGDAKHTLYPKHEIRLAAYAILLEATEHVQVPYGLIFGADSHRGLAVPITPASRQRVVDELERASDKIVRSQSGDSDPRPPADRQRCATCRLGEPVPLSEAEIRSARKAGTRLLVLKDSSDRKFHCACGDRFGSAPPHRRIAELGLTATVE